MNENYANFDASAVPIPKYGHVQEMNQEVEKEFRFKFNQTFFNNMHDNSGPLIHILENLKTFVEKHQLNRAAMIELLFRVFTNKGRDMCHTHLHILGCHIDDFWTYNQRSR